MLPDRYAVPAEVRNVRPFSIPAPLDWIAPAVICSSASEPMNLRVRRLWHFLWSRFRWLSVGVSRILPALVQTGGNMGFLDKLLGRGKKAAGDVTGDASLRSERVARNGRRTRRIAPP